MFHGRGIEFIVIFIDGSFSAAEYDGKKQTTDRPDGIIAIELMLSLRAAACYAII
jgi:hypothetical protein